MNHPIQNHVVFIDFENVPEVDLSLIAAHPANVTFLIGKNQKKLDLSLVRQVLRLGSRIELIEVGASGRNALDLTLAYYLGQAVLKSPQAAFHIISKDSDFDALIQHLRSNEVTIARHTSLNALPFLPPVKEKSAAAQKRPEDRRGKVIARLKDPKNTNRPSTKDALLSNIKTALGKASTHEMPEDILRELLDSGIITIDAGTKKVIYASKA